MLRRRFIAAGLSVLLLGTAAGCRSIDNSEGAAPEGAGSEINAGLDGSVAREEATIANVKQSGGEVRVIAAGDNMVQTAVYNSAVTNTETGQIYNFGYCYGGVRDIISQGDISIINQESLICNDPDIAISGASYNLNSPSELGPALLDAGFNVISMANEHLLDNGIDGLESCMDYWEQMEADNPDLLTYGVYRSEADMNDIRIKEINGIKVAFLAYTEGLNGYSVPDDSSVRVVLTAEDAIIKSQIEAAKELADAVVVAAHWGTVDSSEVSESVRYLAQNMVEWGADVIIGTHPHVPQTMEYLTREDGTQGFVFYSLGNFISSQTWNINLVGEIADFNIVVDPEGNTTIEDVKVIPVITHYDDGYLSNVRLYSYSDYNDELCASHGLPYAMYDQVYAEWNMEKIKAIVDEAVPAEFQKLD